MARRLAVSVHRGARCAKRRSAFPDRPCRCRPRPSDLARTGNLRVAAYRGRTGERRRALGRLAHQTCPGRSRARALGGRMNVHRFKSLVLPALLAGTSRQPIDYSRLLAGGISPGDPKCGLKALALTGQALRFERPAPPSDYAAIQVRNPSRRNVSEALRPMLVRLFGDGKSAVPPQDHLALAMALALERHRVQPHPFDFPRMDGFLRAHAERLGPDACAWVDRDKASEAK